MSGPFDRLHRGIQRWMWSQDWTDLRPIQAAAIDHILGGGGDTIISAMTAGGKTEAAFLPILSSIADDYEGAVRAVYVGPLRALINDQFRRMESLCAKLEIPVHRWHGEVGQAERRKLMEHPGGVLLITPESIESLFLNRTGHLQRVFARLAWVVIDELHVFPGTERGAHLRSLLHRLEEARPEPVHRIGLSATLGDPKSYARWLRPSCPDGVHLIQAPATEVQFRTRIHGYVGAPAQMEVDILKNHARGVHLVFANAKREIEGWGGRLRERLAIDGRPSDQVILHHGSLAREVREDAERMLLAGGDRICCCSSTLELGVDIGSVAAVGHIGSPWRVAGLAQRVGRSGRRPGEPMVLRQYHPIEDPGIEGGLSEEALFLGLVRGIAATRLYIDGWCETPAMGRHCSSTLVHQIIALLGAYPGLTAHRMYTTLAHRDAFTWLTSARFAELLRHLAAQRILTQAEDGGLLLDVEGEALVNARDFYPAFTVDETYRVRHGGRALGEVTNDQLAQLAVGGHIRFRLAGRSWAVESINQEDKTIDVSPATGGDPLVFNGEMPDLDGRLAAEIRQVLLDDADVGFIDETAADFLHTARARFAHERLAGRSWSSEARGGTALWLWSGSAIQRTISAACALAGLRATPGQVSVTVEISPPGCRQGLEQVAGTLATALPAALAKLPENLYREKHDPLLPVSWLVDQFIAERYDVAGAEQAIANLLADTSFR